MTVLSGILFLLFAHTLADFALQSSWMAENKGKYWWLMAAHCTIYTGIVYLAMMRVLVTANDAQLFVAIPILFITHWLFDKWKCEDVKKGVLSDTELVILDQAAHIVILVVMFGAMGGMYAH